MLLMVVLVFLGLDPKRPDAQFGIILDEQDLAMESSQEDLYFRDGRILTLIMSGNVLVRKVLWPDAMMQRWISLLFVASKSSLRVSNC